MSEAWSTPPRVLICSEQSATRILTNNSSSHMVRTPPPQHPQSRSHPSLQKISTSYVYSTAREEPKAEPSIRPDTMPVLLRPSHISSRVRAGAYGRFGVRSGWWGWETGGPESSGRSLVVGCCGCGRKRTRNKSVFVRRAKSNSMWNWLNHLAYTW